jgi:hypothetical protein
MTSTQKFLTGCILGAALFGNSGLAQKTPAQSSADALHSMAQQAGVIFTGQVVAVRQHVTPAGSPAGVVEIEFAVQDAVRGVSGVGYILREWAGLSAGGDVPFRVGQRYLMLLHPAGVNGLSSPVGGTDGAIPLTATGTAVGPSGVLDSETAETASADGLAVDLRWVATRRLRPTGYATPLAARPVPVGADALSPAGPDALSPAGPDVLSPAGPDALSSVSAQDLPPPIVARGSAPIDTVTASAATSATYATVLGMLRSWEKNDHGAN